MRAWPVLAMALSLSGCATYSPLPLDTAAHAPSVVSLQALKIDTPGLKMPDLGTHVFDPSNGLDMTEVAVLAVANNPQLKLARDQLGIARAQAFSAGLLPDPVFGLEQDTPMGGAQASTSAFNLALSYDVSALITHAATEHAARDTERQVNLDLLWQEWQVVGRARRLFIQARYQDRAVKLLRREMTLLRQHHRALRDAYRHRDVALQTVSADAVRLQKVRDRLDGLQRRRIATRHALDTLLGLSADARLDLVGPADLPAVDAAGLKRRLDELPQRRPDLLALAAGYRSQDQRYRAAILRQFPAIRIGFVRSRDTGNVNTYGFDLSVSLPIFNGNRGAVAVARATRQRLHDVYSARLLQARSDIVRILQEQRVLESQRRQIKQDALAAMQTARAAAKAHRRADLSDSAYVAAQVAWFDNQRALWRTDSMIQEGRATLQILLGASAPAAHSGA